MTTSSKSWSARWPLWSRMPPAGLRPLRVCVSECCLRSGGSRSCGTAISPMRAWRRTSIWPRCSCVWLAPPKSLNTPMDLRRWPAPPAPARSTNSTGACPAKASAAVRAAPVPRGAPVRLRRRSGHPWPPTATPRPAWHGTISANLRHDPTGRKRWRKRSAASP